jgi:AcrR family transcriptional regulator
MTLNSRSTSTTNSHSRRRNSVGTREAILDAARAILAQDGKKGLRVSKVASLARVDRGTAYRHFPTRAELIEATMESVSDKIFHAMYGNLSQVIGQTADSDAVKGVTELLVDFAVENSDLSRAWLTELLSSQRPVGARLWQAFESRLQDLAKTDCARPNIDTEVASVLMLAGIFIWPVWAGVHARDSGERRAMTKRLAREVLRLSMHGTLNPEKFPRLDAYLTEERQGLLHNE